jgi:hypothetical protein
MTSFRSEYPIRWVRRKSIGSGVKRPPPQIAAGKSIGPNCVRQQAFRASLLCQQRSATIARNNFYMDESFTQRFHLSEMGKWLQTL